MSLRVFLRLMLLGTVTFSGYTPAAGTTEIREAVDKFQSFFESRYPDKFIDAEASEIQTDFPEADGKFNKGQQFFWSRRGQLNYSCASCHVDNAGKQLNGETIPPALGIASNYPKQLANNKSRSLHEQYQICNTRTRARPFALQSAEYDSLEFYLATVSSGVKLLH